MPPIPFVKASACGNDFLIIDGQQAPADIGVFTRLICDRHNGIGADGVEWVLPATDADLAIRLINADGSEAEISANGTRCVAAWFCAENGRDSVAIRTGAGLKTCDLTARDGFHFEFRTSLGQPEVGGEFTVSVGDRIVRGVPVSMGNPHFIVFVHEFESGWQTWAGHVSTHPDWEWALLDPAHHADIIIACKGDPVWMSAGEHRGDLTELFAITVPGQTKCAIYRPTPPKSESPKPQVP